MNTECSRCGCKDDWREEPGTPPHEAKYVCTNCGAFMGWKRKDANEGKRKDKCQDWRARHKESLGGELVCLVCGLSESQISITFHIHHWVPISEDGPDEFGNTSPLCVYCHNHVHALRYKAREYAKAMREAGL